MAGKTFGDLTATTTLADADLFAVEKDGNSRKVTAANVRGYMAAPLLTILERSTGQSVNTGTDTDASWDTTALKDDVSAFAGGSPTLLTTPTGFTWVRFSLFGCWDSNSTGARVYQFKKGATLMCVDHHAAGLESGGLVTTRWLPTVATDAWKITLFQNSGGTRTFNSASASYGRVSWQAEWRP